MQRDELYNTKIINPGKLHRGNPALPSEASAKDGENSRGTQRFL
jgi:hypothetical protein